MHPDIWTVPGIGMPIRAYGLFSGIGIVVALLIAIRRAKQVGYDPATVTSMSLIGVVMGIVGCRVMHYVHYFSREIETGELGVKEIATAMGGGEILGGVVLGVASAIAYLAIRRKPIWGHLDVVFPPMVLAMGIGRIGCLMFGCCWGGLCTTEAGDQGLLWVVRFPYGSPPYLRHYEEGRLVVPNTLLWKSPVTKELEPIPRDVLARINIDGDTALEDWAEKAEAYRAAKKDHPDNEDTARLEAQARAAAEALGEPSIIELAAAVHLRNLANRPDGSAMTWGQLRDLAAGQHSLWVHPAQLYDAMTLGLLYWVLTAIFHRRKASGTVVAWAMILYPLNRFVQEMIRGDNPHDVLNLTISQFMCILIFMLGVVLAVRLKTRSDVAGGSASAVAFPEAPTGPAPGR